MDETGANIIRIEGNSVVGNIATLAFDVDVTGERLTDEDDESPVYCLYGHSPRGQRVKVGAIWRRPNPESALAYTLVLHTGHGRWFAHLSQAPGTDGTIFEVIPTDYLNGDRRK